MFSSFALLILPCDYGALEKFANTADKCFNGNSDATKSLTDCPSSGGVCPSLNTGLTCTANGKLAPDLLVNVCINFCLYVLCFHIVADLCVKGAKCLNGKCYPNSKVFASATTNPAPTPTVSPKPLTLNATSDNVS